MKTPNPSHLRSLSEIVASDLRFVRDEWKDDISTDALRRGAAVLRMLLIEGYLQRAWKAEGFCKEPVIPATVIEPAIDGRDARTIAWAFAGGGVGNGIQAAVLIATNYAMSEQEIKEQMMRGQPCLTRVPLGLQKYTNGRCGVIGGETLTRRDVVKYVANRLGSTHHGRSGKESPAEKRLYDQLDAISPQAAVAGHPTIYFELLSIGQSIIGAPDVEAFMAHADKAFPKV